MVPGEVCGTNEPITILGDCELVELEVRNVGDRAIQVGSHYHFFEVNPALEFDRARAHHRRLAIPAGTSLRFEPGIPRTVQLVELGGSQHVPGLRRDERPSSA